MESGLLVLNQSGLDCCRAAPEYPPGGTDSARWEAATGSPVDASRPRPAPPRANGEAAQRGARKGPGGDPAVGGADSGEQQRELDHRVEIERAPGGRSGLCAIGGLGE